MILRNLPKDKKKCNSLKTMRLIKKVLFAVVMLFCFMNMKCESNDDELIIDTDNLLLGYWEAPEYDADKITFRRASKLPEEGFGLQFKPKGGLVEHASGWGVTPPLTFADRNGKWEMIGTNVIAVTQAHFPNNYTWEIEALTTTELVVTRAVTPQEKEHRALLEAFKTLEENRGEMTCEVTSEWGVTTYGNKACGGPRGVLVYPKTIDTTAFLNAVQAYTKTEQAYNEKWGVFSTCEVLALPTSVVCIEGVPVLQFE